MSDTAAALKDMNQAIKLNSSAELFVNRGVIYQVISVDCVDLVEYK